MMPSPVEIPLARAQAHLAMARYPLAVGAFRAAVGVDPRAVEAHLGLAEALAAQGRRQEAVDGLLVAAEAFSAREERTDAMGLLDRALVIEPARIELHLDMAMLEEAMGRHDAAVVRVEGLAERYMDGGRTDEAAELLRFLATWEEGESETEDAVAPGAPELVPDPAPARAAWLPAIITGETVIARNPLLDAPPARPSVRKLEVELGDIDRLVVHEPDLESLVTRVADSRRLPRRAPTPASRRTSPPRVVVEDANPVVDRLRTRAGLHAAAPRAADTRGTEAITLRPTIRPSARRGDEDVTVRYRRPRALAAS